MSVRQWEMESHIGSFFLVASEKGLKSLLWKKSSVPFAVSLNEVHPAIQILNHTLAQLQEYFLGKRQQFDIPLDMNGTVFQKRVWKQLLQIPYGETRAYKDIAQMLGNEKASRAVGMANAKNPISIIVPCQRVIAANGTLGGYAGGLDIKAQLLHLENARFLR